MATPEPPITKTCPNCGANVPLSDRVCPECGTPLPANGNKWYQNLTATEIFLLILGSIMLAIGLVAV